METTELEPPSDQLPRERLLRAGPGPLGDHELLALVVGTGVRARPVHQLARELLDELGGVGGLSRATPRELASSHGVGAARAARIAAAFELGRRVFEHEHHRTSISDPSDVQRVLAPRLAGVAQEVFFVLGLDSQNGLIDVVEVARGSVASVEVHPREVFRPLVRMAAAGAVIAHNHPSGNPTPSDHDVELTRRLFAVGELMGIPLVDHVVVADRAFRSVREWLGGFA